MFNEYRFNELIFGYHDNGVDLPIGVDSPIVSILSVDKTTISKEEGMDTANILFKFGFNQDIQSWKAVVNGSSHDTGEVAVLGGSAKAGDELVAEIHWSQLYSEGENRVNLYGQSLSGEWTPYNDSRDIDDYVFKRSIYGQNTYGSATYGKY